MAVILQMAFWNTVLMKIIIFWFKFDRFVPTEVPIYNWQASIGSGSGLDLSTDAYMPNTTLVSPWVECGNNIVS